jgi:hypothetical protein
MYAQYGIADVFLANVLQPLNGGAVAAPNPMGESGRFPLWADWDINDGGRGQRIAVIQVQYQTHCLT